MLNNLSISSLIIIDFWLMGAWRLSAGDGEGNGGPGTRAKGMTQEARIMNDQLTNRLIIGSSFIN